MLTEEEAGREAKMKEGQNHAPTNPAEEKDTSSSDTFSHIVGNKKTQSIHGIVRNPHHHSPRAERAREAKRQH